MIIYDYFDGDNFVSFTNLAEAKKSARKHLDYDLEINEITIRKCKVVKLNLRNFVDAINGDGYILTHSIAFIVKRRGDS